LCTNDDDDDRKEDDVIESLCIVYIYTIYTRMYVSTSPNIYI